MDLALRAVFFTAATNSIVWRINNDMINVEKLIEVVYKYPFLYDLSHEDYKDLRKKDKTWIEIGKELNESGEHVKKKWKNLKDTYAKYMRCSKKKLKHTARSKRTWIWAEKMKIFDGYLKCPQTSSNISDVHDESVNIESTRSLKTEDNELKPEKSGKNLAKDEPNTEIRKNRARCEVSSQSLRSMPLDASDAISLAPKASGKKSKKRKLESSSTIKEVIKRLKSERQMEYDAIDQIFLGYAKTIKTFSGTRQAVTKMKIARVIMEQELLHHREIASTSSFKAESAVRRQDNRASNDLTKLGCADDCFDDFSADGSFIRSESAMSSSSAESVSIKTNANELRI